jgi:hypothetical protein
MLVTFLNMIRRSSSVAVYRQSGRSNCNLVDKRGHKSDNKYDVFPIKSLGLCQRKERLKVIYFGCSKEDTAPCAHTLHLKGYSVSHLILAIFVQVVAILGAM